MSEPTLIERARAIMEAALPMIRKDIHLQAVSDLEQTAYIHLEAVRAQGARDVERLRKVLWEIATDPYPYDTGADMQQLAQDALGMTDEEVKAAIAEWLQADHSKESA